MSSHDLQTPIEIDSVRRSLENWAARQEPPASVRARIMRKAGARRANQERRRSLLLRVKQFASPYWPGQPRNYAELSRWLFSKAMLESMNMDRSAIRLVS